MRLEIMIIVKSLFCSYEIVDVYRNADFESPRVFLSIRVFLIIFLTNEYFYSNRVY